MFKVVESVLLAVFSSVFVNFNIFQKNCEKSLDKLYKACYIVVEKRDRVNRKGKIQG